MASTAQLMTAEELLQTPDLGRCELVRGELIPMSPSGSEHGEIVISLAAVLREFVKARSLGRVLGADPGFVISHDPDTVRAPDVAFICADRIRGRLPRGFFPGPPDLAVEVVSPNDRASEVLAKTRMWLAAGCRAVWVVDPETETVSIHRNQREILVLGKEDTLTDDEVLPGFSLPMAAVFE